MKISERADRFANKLRPKAPVDETPTDVKLAEFSQKYSTEALKKARKAANTSSMSQDVERWAKSGFPGNEPYISKEFAAFKQKHGNAGVAAFKKRWHEIRGLKQRSTPGVIERIK